MHYTFKPTLTARVAVSPEEIGRFEHMMTLCSTKQADLADPKSALAYVKQVETHMHSVISSAVASHRLAGLNIEYGRSDSGVGYADCYDPVSLERFLVILEEVAS